MVQTTSQQPAPPVTNHKAWTGALVAALAVGGAQFGLTAADAQTLADLVLSFVGLAPAPPVEKVETFVSSVLAALGAGIATWIGVYYKRNYAITSKGARS